MEGGILYRRLLHSIYVEGFYIANMEGGVLCRSPGERDAACNGDGRKRTSSR